MKILLSIICWLFAIFSIYFPFSYFHKAADVKEVKLSHIQLETEEQAIELKNKLDNGENFEKLVKEYSLCPSKANDGNLGYMMKGKLVPEIEKVAFSLKRFEVSEPVKSDWGWHLLKVYDISYFSDRENFAYRYDINRLIKTIKS